jgi:hypothetical protein
MGRRKLQREFQYPPKSLLGVFRDSDEKTSTGEVRWRPEVSLATVLVQNRHYTTYGSKVYLQSEFYCLADETELI